MMRVNGLIIQRKLLRLQLCFINNSLKKEDTDDFLMLEVLPNIVTYAQNMELKRIPNIAEVKKAVMGLNRNSTAGPDGMKIKHSCVNQN